MNRISKSDLHNILESTANLLNDNFVSGSNILITGATGFFGKWLLESMLFSFKEFSLKTKIFALSRNPAKFLEKYPFYQKESRIVWIKGDITSFEFPSEHISYIIHCATEADAKLNIENPLLMMDTIVLGTKRILDFAKSQAELKAILLISSGAVYGKQPDNVSHLKEEFSYNVEFNNIRSVYAEGKRLSELYGLIYFNQFKVPVKIARCFAFVGPYLPLDKHFAIGNFIRDGLKGNNITIHGDGSPLRSYMYSSDLVIWLLTLLLKGNTGEPYNVGSDKIISIKELAFIVSNFFPGISVNILNKVYKTDRNQNYIPDIQKAKKQFGFPEGVSIHDAINKTIKFNEQNE
jgi:nucleoside-diphosphate-sugar epimerase